MHPCFSDVSVVFLLYVCRVSVVLVGVVVVVVVVVVCCFSELRVRCFSFVVVVVVVVPRIKATRKAIRHGYHD